MFSSTGLRWLWLVGLVFVIDITTKLWIVHTLPLYQSIPILPFFNLSHQQNMGAAFSMFWGQRWILVVVALSVSVLLLFMLYKTTRSDRLGGCALALILGGALGNLFDRINHGFVIDFFDVILFSWHYPTFNIADIAICVGVGLLILTSFRQQGEKT